MALADITDWMDEYGKPGTIWLAKRLSANDTQANRSHQAGPYMPKAFLFRVFPNLNRPAEVDPDVRFTLYVASRPDVRTVRAIWYNNRTRDEARVTGFGGRKSALLDPDSTGALAVFAFVLDQQGTATECHVWVCRDETEEDLFEDRLGPVEPKAFVVWEPGAPPAADLFAEKPAAKTTCRLEPGEIPPAWLAKFPSGEEIIERTITMRPPTGMDPDVRLLKRRRCEYELFLSVEEAVYLPRIRTGAFSSVSGFLGLAQTILQSRKSRSGKSLELHAREILREEGLLPGVDFTHNPISEGKKRPDFLFPSKAAYDDPAFPADRLRMLAAKTTCKDRWRQVISEADRVPTKHLLTLQEGVSENQFQEMRDAGVQLVVPGGLHTAYPKEVRPHLIAFESFIADVRLLRVGIGSPHSLA